MTFEKLTDASRCLYQAILYLQQIGYNQSVVDELIKQRDEIITESIHAWNKREVTLNEAWQMIGDTEG